MRFRWRVFLQAAAPLAFVLACGRDPSAPTTTEVPLPPTCQDDGRPKGEPSYTLAIDEVVELPFTSFRQHSFSTPGILSVEQLDTRMRITALRPGETKLFLINSSGQCVYFEIVVQPPPTKP
jgi:hypothetical protein